MILLSLLGAFGMYVGLFLIVPIAIIKIMEWWNSRHSRTADVAEITLKNTANL